MLAAAGDWKWHSRRCELYREEKKKKKKRILNELVKAGDGGDRTAQRRPARSETLA